MTAPRLEEMSDNALLAKLREEDRKRLIPHAMVFELKAGEVLQEAGVEVIHTWFPCGSALGTFSVWVDAESEAVEVALIGREGAIGGIVSNGSAPAFATSQVRADGKFLRVKISALEQVKLESLAMRHWFSRYSDCLIAQLFQTAACNASHTISQRAAKWLLAAAARTGGSDLQITQDQLAKTLGVGRTFVTRIIKQFRDDSIIATRRGRMIVQDENGLRARSCACTTAIEDHFDNVLHGIYPRE